jgi:hypothetical protein
MGQQSCSEGRDPAAREHSGKIPDKSSLFVVFDALLCGFVFG